jgi:ATP-dependent exoDNAse (exonuclease V) alpha subunit
MFDTPMRFEMIKRVRTGELNTVFAAAAYASRSQLHFAGQHYDYTGRVGDLIVQEILTPADAPPWTKSRRKLWTAVEIAEEGPEARLARQLVLWIPPRLDPPNMSALARGFAQECLVAMGMVVDLAVHDPSRVGKESGPHAHLLTTLRRLEAWGFGEVAREWSRDDLRQSWREDWARRCKEGS